MNHEELVDEVEESCTGNTAKELNYYNKDGLMAGDIDVLNVKDDITEVYEIKSTHNSRNFNKAIDQLNRVNEILGARSNLERYIIFPDDDYKY